MTVTKVECPNCHGQLDIPDGLKEGFVTCKFCNTKVYIEPYKPNITQNFNIKEVNYNKSGATVRNNSKLLNVIAVVVILGILSTAFLFVSGCDEKLFRKGLFQAVVKNYGEGLCFFTVPCYHQEEGSF